MRFVASRPDRGQRGHERHAGNAYGATAGSAKARCHELQPRAGTVTVWRLLQDSPGERDHDCGRRRARRRASDEPARAAVGPRLRVRGDAGDGAALARSQLGRIRPLDAHARSDLVGVVGVRVGNQRAGGELANAAAVPAARDDLHPDRRARGPGRVCWRRHLVRRRLHRRSAPAPRAVRRRVPSGERVLHCDRGVRRDRRDRHGAASRRHVRTRRSCGSGCGSQPPRSITQAPRG